MSLIIGEAKIPALCIAHLTARITDPDNPMPALNVLPLIAGPIKGTARVTPSVEIWCPSFTLGTRRDDERYGVMIDLYTNHADISTTLATELGWLAAIRRAFAGGPISANSNAADAASNPFFAYLLALDDPASAGWRIDDFYISGGAIHILDQKRTLYRTEAKCAFRTQTLTV